MDNINLVVPWFSFEYNKRIFADIFEEDLGISINKNFQLADECLEQIMKRKFPLILVNFNF